MKKLFPILLVLLSQFTFGYSSNSDNVEIPKKIIVAGRIINYDPQVSFSILVNRLGYEAEEINVQVDPSGNFHSTFESAIPTDAWFRYNSNFLIVLKPLDSLYITMDGKAPKPIKTASYQGSSAETNRYVSKFQELYDEIPLFRDLEANRLAVKSLEPNDFITYNNDLLNKRKDFFQRFVDEFKPNEESQLWASFFIEDEYYANVTYYAMDHREANNMRYKDLWDVPSGFYNQLLMRLPLSRANLMNGFSVNAFSQRLYPYVNSKLKEQSREGDPWSVLPGGGLVGISDTVDSVTFHGTLEHMPDTFLRQVALVHNFNSQITKFNVANFEKYRDLIDKHVTIPWLKKPLFDKYAVVKEKLINPNLHAQTIIKKLDSASAEDIFRDIIQSNKGRVIYVDFWGTWCAPCIQQMPFSRQLSQELRPEDVTFVYIALTSPEDQFMASIAEFQLSGQHYFLSATQSHEIMKYFEMPGVPFYMLIDKNGNISEASIELRPREVKGKIQALLKL